MVMYYGLITSKDVIYEYLLLSDITNHIFILKTCMPSSLSLIIFNDYLHFPLFLLYYLYFPLTWFSYHLH